MALYSSHGSLLTGSLASMPKKPASSSKQTSLFDIRLKNHEHDVLVLKGPPEDAASALLSGKIMLSVNDPFTVKRISLRLYATLRIYMTDQVNTTKGSYPKNIKHERKIYEYNWDTQEMNKYLNNMYENLTSATGGSGVGLQKTNSTSSLKSLGHFRSKSSNNLTSLKSSPSGSSTNLSMLSSTANSKATHTLVKGNYEIPFSAILPGNMPESVEGLPGASVVYKLEATIDRGKFHNPMVAKKHLRVVRTLNTDAVELSETVAVDNTWPKKVEYSLTVPNKAIAIGSGLPISLMIVPLLKGLLLGETRISLVEYYSYIGYVPPVKNGERVIANKTIPKPLEDDPNFQLDKWEIQTFLRVPPTLAKCTQDCDVLTNIKVRHKIKFAIGLVNPDGHVSELRASLPVQLFISPFVTLRAVADDEGLGLVDSEGEEEILFTADRSNNASQTNLVENTSAVQSTSSSYSSFSGLVAPPLYEQHIYDRLWSDVSPIDSPSVSGTATPREIHSAPSGMHDLNMSPIDSVQLNENLRLLSLQRQAQESAASTASTPSARATFSLDAENDYFSHRNLSRGNSSAALSGLVSPGAPSPAAFLSRTQSESLMNSGVLSRVPSYHEAMKSPEEPTEPFSPLYEPPLPESKINLEEVNKVFERTKSATSSPPYSRNVSGTNLQKLLQKSQPHSPENEPMLTVSSNASASVAKLSSSASDRSAAVGSAPIRSNSSLSLQNIHFLNKKKDKKQSS